MRLFWMNVPQPLDAGDLTPGRDTEVRFSALQERNLPILRERLTRISADSFEDGRSGMRYFQIEAIANRASWPSLTQSLWIAGREP